MRPLLGRLRALLARLGATGEPAPHVLDPSRGEDRCGRCGHERRAHEHLRRGTDCALCPCGRFRYARRPQAY